MIRIRISKRAKREADYTIGLDLTSATYVGIQVTEKPFTSK